MSYFNLYKIKCLEIKKYKFIFKSVKYNMLSNFFLKLFITYTNFAYSKHYSNYYNLFFFLILLLANYF